LRKGSYSCGFLEPRRTAQKALTAVIQEAYVQAFRRVPSTSQSRQWGKTGISKGQVSRFCAEIDERLNAFLNRPIEGDWPCVWTDATYVKVRADGTRELLGVGPSEAEPFWIEFLRSLRRRR
jgi:putative transposase